MSSLRLLLIHLKFSFWISLYKDWLTVSVDFSTRFT
nr:MAG TPA: hypothetical protein [Caudoviricetes sp.]